MKTVSITVGIFNVEDDIITKPPYSHVMIPWPQPTMGKKYIFRAPEGFQWIIEALYYRGVLSELGTATFLAVPEGTTELETPKVVSLRVGRFKAWYIIINQQLRLLRETGTPPSDNLSDILVGPTTEVLPKMEALIASLPIDTKVLLLTYDVHNDDVPAIVRKLALKVWEGRECTR